MKILIAGDSFAADWKIKYNGNGWVNMLSNDYDVTKAIQQGYNVATVFGIKKTLPMPETYIGMPVFNGDESDLRFLDPKGVVVGLYAKGKAKKDTSGFVKYPTLMLQYIRTLVKVKLYFKPVVITQQS